MTIDAALVRVASAGTASIASVAFLMMLVSACEISRRSNCAGIGSSADLDLDIDIGMADAHQEHDLAHRVGDVLAVDHRLRHARKAREFVDHAPDIVDLAHDGVGALLEDGLVLDDDLAVFAAQPLGRKLDRRQRILDFMGDAARDVGPGRGALRRNQFGDVVERDDIAVARLAGLLGADADRQIALAGRRG